jgi:hypothetical protein
MFPALFASANVGFYTKDLDICKGELAEIYAESWKDVVDQIGEIRIMNQKPKVGIQDGANGMPTNLRDEGISCVSFSTIWHGSFYT